MDKQREELIRTRGWSETVRAENDGGALDDPELREFEKRSSEFNQQVHRALDEVPIPPGLRERILAAGKAADAPNVVRVRNWRVQPGIWAAAAALVILGMLVAFWKRPEEDKTFAGFRNRMVGFALRQYSMDIHTNQVAAVRSFLAQRDAPADFSIPGALAATPVIGGARLSWQDKPVGMVCFAGTTGKTLYMFVINSADVPGAVAGPEISRQKSLSTATWRAGERTFLLAGDVSLEELEKLVSPQEGKT